MCPVYEDKNLFEQINCGIDADQTHSWAHESIGLVLLIGLLTWLVNVLGKSSPLLPVASIETLFGKKAHQRYLSSLPSKTLTIEHFHQNIWCIGLLGFCNINFPKFIAFEIVIFLLLMIILFIIFHICLFV